MRANSIDTEFSCADTCGRGSAGFPEWTPDPGNGSRTLRQSWQRRKSHVPVTFATAMRQDAFSARHGEVPPGRSRPGCPGLPNSPRRQAAVTGLPPRPASLPGKPDPGRAAVLLDTPGKSVAGVAVLASAPIRNARMPSVCPTRAAPGSMAAGAMDSQRAGLVGSISNCAASRLPWRKVVCPDGSGRHNGRNADCTLKSGKSINLSASTHCVVPLGHPGGGAAQAHCANASWEDGSGKFAGLIASGLMRKNADSTSPGGGASFRALKTATTFPTSDRCAMVSKIESGMTRSGKTLAPSVFGTCGAHGITVADRVCAVEQEFELHYTISCSRTDTLHGIFNNRTLNGTGSGGGDRYTRGNFGVDIGMANARRRSRTVAPAAEDMGIKRGASVMMWAMARC